MDSVFVGQLEALDPTVKTIYIEFIPLKGGDNTESYTVELKKTPNALTDFLRKIKAKVGKKNAKIGSYAKYAKALIDNKIGEIFVLKSNLQKLINKFNITPRTVEGLVRFSKKIKLNSPLKIGETIYKSGSILKFTHEEK